jgi:DNA-directed RNA polymerase subunit RPC12/RpoP
MSQIRFPCSGCGVTLAVAFAMAGKLAACPKCKQRSTIPMFEVVEEPVAAAPPPPPPPPPARKPAAPLKPELDEVDEEPIRFPCSKCGAKIVIGANRAGLAIPCPKCGARTLAPELEEVGSYGLVGGKKGREERAEEQPLGTWWPDGKQLKLPGNWREDLAEARDFAERERWQKALAVLHDLQKLARGDGVDIDLLKKPIAYCLAKWSEVELDRVKRGEKLSKPLRTVLKRAGTFQQWGGSFSSSECAACGRSLPHTVGTIQLRTAAGSAYMCCAGPTETDAALVAQVQGVSRKLALASHLDPECPAVADAQERVPQWYRALDLSEPGWARIVAEGGAAGAAAGALGYVIGDALGEALGEALGNILFG